jgi:hypothetical protein
VAGLRRKRMMRKRKVRGINEWVDLEIERGR